MAALAPRTLALVLPLLPIEVARHRAGTSDASRRPPGPLALTERRGAGANATLVISAVSPEARKLGVVPGSTHAQALAAASELVVLERRLEDEQAALVALARWAMLALSPRVATDHERLALLVDVTGTALVHGSEQGLVERALDDLLTGQAAGIAHAARGAIASTPLAALAVATWSRARSSVVPPESTRDALLPLPPRALGLEDKVLERLAAIGVRTIEQLLALPRGALPARFGDDLVLRIDEALGARPLLLEPERPPEELREKIDLDGGTDHPESIALAVEQLAARVLERLVHDALAARAIELVFAREDGPPDRFPARLAAPVSRLPLLLGVLRERLERLDLARPVLAIELRVTETARTVERQADLFSRHAAQAGDTEQDLACLVARLEGRLGPRRVVKPELVSDHRPERTSVDRPASAPPKAGRGATARCGPPAALAPGRRPTRLLVRATPIDVVVDELDVPVRIGLRANAIELVSAVGPERIEVGFWDGVETRRDYWVVMDESGRERWIYRELESGRWWLHGLFD